MTDKQQKERLDELQQYTVPAAKYFWVSGPEIAIHKGFLKYYTATIMIAGIILTLLTEHTPFWLIVGRGFWNLFFIKGWMVTLPAIGVGILYLYIKSERSKKRKLEQLRADARRRKLDELIGN